MHVPRQRRLLIAVISGSLVLTTLALIGMMGLLLGQTTQQPSEKSSSDTRNFATPAAPIATPRPLLITSDSQRFARSVGHSLFTWDTRYDGSPTDWEQVLVDAADPSEAVAVASDVRGYLPVEKMWDQLRAYGTRQWIELETSAVPTAWTTALEQAAPGQIPRGAEAFTLVGVRHREGTWTTKAVHTERKVSFTVFVVCSGEAPCALLRLSRLDQPLW